jgi:hypothetical protein
MRAVQVLAVLFTVISLIPGGAHVLEFHRKITFSADNYLMVQSLYTGWAFIGMAIFSALALNGTAAIMLKGQGTPFQWELAATVLLVVSLAIFFIWTFPVNQTTANWTRLPPNWPALRRQWEYSHLANAAVVFASLVCVTVSMAVTKR